MAEEQLTSRVRQMQSQGYQNSQIIDALQKDGFNSSQIFDAINQAAMPDGSKQDIPPAPNFDDPLPQMPQGVAPSDSSANIPTPEPVPMPNEPAPAPAPQPMASIPQPKAPVRQPPTPQPQPTHTPRPRPTADVSTEEYIEAVIDEKWVELEHDIQKIVDWKNKSEQRITAMHQEVTDLKDRFEKLHAALIGKIDSYDKNILEVGAEIKAMEKVFSKVLPVFTDNVKQLQDITDDLGRKSK